MDKPSLILNLPDWVETAIRRPGSVFPSGEDRMRIVIELARMNVERGGGPFAAAIFDLRSGELIAPGVNLVLSLNCSAAHAEMVAIIMVQQITGSYDLAAAGSPPCELVSSTEPCAMCLGAIPWSGVRRLVCGASGEDAAAIGFDEGAKPAAWQQELEARGIEVVRGVCRSEAAAVLRQYADQGGIIYNPALRKGV